MCNFGETFPSNKSRTTPTWQLDHVNPVHFTKRHHENNDNNDNNNNNHDDDEDNDSDNDDYDNNNNI